MATSECENSPSRSYTIGLTLVLTPALFVVVANGQYLNSCTRPRRSTFTTTTVGSNVVKGKGYWRENKKRLKPEHIPERGTTSNIGERTVGDFPSSNFPGSSGADSASTRGTCLVRGGGATRSLSFNIVKGMDPGSQRCNQLAGLKVARGGLNAAKANSCKNTHTCLADGGEGKSSQSESSSDDGIGVDTGVVDITNCLDIIDEVSF